MAKPHPVGAPPRRPPLHPTPERTGRALALHAPPTLAVGHILYDPAQLMLEVAEILERSSGADDGRELPTAWSAQAVADELQTDHESVLATLDFLVYSGRACVATVGRSGRALYRRLTDRDSAFEARQGGEALITGRLAGRYVAGGAWRSA